MSGKENSGKHLLEIDNLTKHYQNNTSAPVLQDFSLSIDRKEFLCILGPSGCGKSTLLRCIGGFESFEGSVYVKGERREAPGPDRVMVFQDFNQLFPWKTVKKNIQYAIKVKLHIKDKKLLESLSNKYLNMVSLEKYGDYFPHQLSGGMKQRAAIARALAIKPEIILMDEPFASLDAMTREKLQKELLDIFNKEDITVLFVTHNIEEAITLGTRVLVMGRGGRIVTDLKNNIEKPASPVVKGYAELWAILTNSLK